MFLQKNYPKYVARVAIVIGTLQLLLLSTYWVWASAMVLPDPSPRVEAEGEDGTGGCKHQAKQDKEHHLSGKLPF